MELLDTFCMLLELFLYGFDILTKNEQTIFDLNSSIDDIIYVIKDYFKSAGFDIFIHEEISLEWPPLDSITLCSKTNYYCKILSKSSTDLYNHTGWCVLNYKLVNNPNFQEDKITNLDNIKACLISKQNRLFTINFQFFNVK